MLKLLLIRHAKSSWKDTTLADIDRPLNARGKRDAPEMAARLQKSVTNVELIISSPAVRAQAFAQEIAAALNVQLQMDDAFYTFSSSVFLRALQNMPEAFQRIAVVGHNPAITEAANYLAGTDIVNVPTSGIVSLECNVQHWYELQPVSCLMEYFDYPKNQV